MSSAIVGVATVKSSLQLILHCTALTYINPFQLKHGSVQELAQAYYIVSTLYFSLEFEV